MKSVALYLTGKQKIDENSNITENIGETDNNQINLLKNVALYLAGKQKIDENSEYEPPEGYIDPFELVEDPHKYLGYTMNKNEEGNK